jgi:hypothetical protein
VRRRSCSTPAEAANGPKSIEGAVLPRSIHIGFRHHNREALCAFVTCCVCRNHVHSFEPALFSGRFEIKRPENNLVQLSGGSAAARMLLGKGCIRKRELSIDDHGNSSNFRG